MRMNGLRTSGRNPLAKAFWMTVMSVVRRVTSEAVWKRSRLPKAKVWIFSYSARRRLAPIPVATREAKRA